MTAKERTFLTEYLKCFNATEAARRAGYAHPNVKGTQVKKKLADEIEAFLDENAMSAAEAIHHLTEIARGTVGPADFIKPREDGKPTVDLELMKEKRGLLKSVNFKTMRIEMQPRMDALKNILMVRGALSGNDPGSSEDKPYIIKVIYEDDNPESTQTP